MCTQRVHHQLSSRSVDQLEEIVEDVVASSSVRHQLEDLCVCHRALLLVNL